MSIDDLTQRTSAPTKDSNKAGSNNKDAAADVDKATRLMRIANLVAAGQMELPVEPPHDDLCVIAQSVRRQNCLALVRHIARCIANELASPTTKEMTDD